MRRYILPLLIVVLTLWAPSVWAQCNQGNIPGCAAAVNPQPTDVLLMYQFGQTPHTRKATVQQLANTTAGTFTNLSVSGNAAITGTLTSGAATLSSLTVPGTVAFTQTGPGAFNVAGTASFGTLTAGSTTVAALLATSVSSTTLTTTSNASVGGTLGVTGITTFSSPYIPQSTTIAGLSGITATPGAHVWVRDCINGSETTGTASGCDYRGNQSSVWTADPSVPTGTFTIGSATPVHLGGSVPGQGNGTTVQMSCATPVNGHVPQYDATGCLVDSGSGPGGGGGSGSVSSGLVNQLGFYAAAGTNISGLAIVNNGVPSYNGSGILAVSTSLPGSLTIPSPTISNENATGTLSAAALTMSGKMTLAASAAAGANLNLPQGTAPTTPANGDIWTTSAGMFVRANGATTGPFISLTSQSATSPLVYNTGTGVESCPTCATTTNGGSLSATVPVAIAATGLITCTTCATTTNGGPITASSPLSISAGGAIALGQLQRYAEFVWGAQTTVTNDTLPMAITIPASAGTIQSVTYFTNGTNSPAFTISLQIAGTPVTGCASLVVGTGGNGVGNTTTATCSAANTFTAGQRVNLVITGAVGTPASAGVQVNYTMTPT